MSDSEFDATIYVKDAPDLSIKDGLIHVCHTTGRMHIELVMRPNTFLKGLRNANRLADEFHAKSEIVAMRSDKA